MLAEREGEDVLAVSLPSVLAEGAHADGAPSIRAVEGRLDRRSLVRESTGKGALLPFPFTATRFNVGDERAQLRQLGCCSNKRECGRES